MYCKPQVSKFLLFFFILFFWQSNVKVEVSHMSFRSSPENILSSTTGGGSTGRRSAWAKRKKRRVSLLPLLLRFEVRYFCFFLTFCSHSTRSCSHRLLQDGQLVLENCTVPEHPVCKSRCLRHIVNLCCTHPR